MEGIKNGIGSLRGEITTQEKDHKDYSGECPNNSKRSMVS
jgi:hypothetical protein